MYSTGIGKTTFANEICLKWAKDTDCFLSNDYDLVILIRLREVKERTLQQVMIDAVGSEAAYDELLTKSHGNRCLIILEGLDEISAHWQQNDTIFCHLVKTTTFLSHANVLVTSRPHACIHLHRDIKDYTRTIEIVGFDKSQIKEYAELYFHNSNTAEKFMVQINNNPHISSLCYVPLCLNMVLECFKRNKDTLHTTLTELYQSFIISKVDEHFHFKIAVSLGTVLESDKQCFENLATVLSDTPEFLLEGALETMFLLSKLAYMSYFEWYEAEKDNKIRSPKIIYTKRDLAHCNITNSGNDACGLLKATNTLFATGNTAVYTFNHLSVQEYFCALYISLLPEEQQLQLLKDHITYYPHMWPFYAGITKLRSSVVLQYMHQLSLQHKIFYWNDDGVSGIVFRENVTVTVLNSIYEAQLLLSDFCKHKVECLLLSRNLHPYDCLSISYFMLIISITYLILRNCDIGDRGAEMLARWQKLNQPSLKLIDLHWNGVTHRGMESIVAIVKCCTNLTHFSLAGNPIGDEGIQLFSLLKLDNLIHLNITDLNMTEVGASALGQWLKHNNSLQSLEISNNNIQDNGLTKILNTIPSTLVRLIAPHCNLTCNGAENIGETLRTNKTLKHLIISNNPIGDDGISAIASGITSNANTALIELNISHCEFHSKGIKSIANVLKINRTLKRLNISKNHIGDDAISTLGLDIQDNTTLTKLYIHSEFIPRNADKLVNITLQVKDMSYSGTKEDVTDVMVIYGDPLGNNQEIDAGGN